MGHLLKWRVKMGGVIGVGVDKWWNYRLKVIDEVGKITEPCRTSLLKEQLWPSTMAYFFLVRLNNQKVK